MTMPISGADASQTPTANGSGALPRPKIGFGMIAAVTPKTTRVASVQTALHPIRARSRSG